VSLKRNLSETSDEEIRMKDDCIFCKIAAKESDATVVYEDPHTLAFLDIHPLNPGHTLVIPKKHYANMLEMSSEEAGRVFASVSKVMKGVQKASAADGISIGQSNGRAASQEVFHMHVHIIPRFNHEMMSGFPNRKQTHRAELDEIGKKIKSAIAI
jgi:histidine triad (HIT) family protein